MTRVGRDRLIGHRLRITRNRAHPDRGGRSRNVIALANFADPPAGFGRSQDERQDTRCAVGEVDPPDVLVLTTAGPATR